MNCLSRRLIDFWSMPKILLLIFFLFLPFFSPYPTRALNLSEAVDSSEKLPNIAKGIVTVMLGSYDENGNRIAKGGINVLGELTSKMYSDPPVSGTRYLTYMKERLNLATPAYATSGQDFLKPMIEIWIINRNLVYLLLVVIFVIVGFMIMFRSKLNPQTVVNIQLALPRIVTALILVTFSYAISGFMVDLVFLFNKILVGIYLIPLKAFPLGHPLDTITPESIDWLGIIYTNSFGSFPAVLENLAKVFSPGTIYDLLIARDFSAIFYIIVAFTIFGVALKIFFTLLTKYVTLFIQAIFSPFIFLAAALPSSKGGLGNFLKSMLSAALAFPGIYLVFILANSVFNLTTPFISLPPLNNTATLALIGGLRPYIALGILMTAPSVPQMIDGALGVKAPGMDVSQIGGALHKIPIIGNLIG